MLHAESKGSGEPTERNDAHDVGGHHQVSAIEPINQGATDEREEEPRQPLGDHEPGHQHWVAGQPSS